ncbi:MAG: hypothetical protein COC05_06445 [Gammaproteobacteria bacterium]|nr:MAG: hypothetical protein COC05_06445 [Gammaproteobacteria bacterium]
MNLKGQSRRMSMLETVVCVIAGYILTVLMQYFLYPLFGIIVPAKEALLISMFIVIIAFVKNFAVRRLFNAVHVKKIKV